MKAEVCLRLRLVCPIVSLPLSLSLPLFLSFILASISLSSSVCVASFALLRSRFFTVTSFRYRPIDLNIFVLTLPFCEAGGYRRVPDAPRIGVNDRFYEASLGLLAQLPHAMTDDGAGAPPPAASYRKLKTPGTSPPVLVVIFWCSFPEKLELRAGDKFMTHLFIDL